MFWDVIAFLVNAGHTSEVAIDKVMYATVEVEV